MNDNIYDVIIIGGGLSGMSAAVEAGDHGLKTLVLEKGRNIGGSGNYVEGVFAADSDMQKEKGVALNKDKVLKEEMNYSHFEASHDMWKKYIDQAGKNVNWLKDKGVKFIDVVGLGSGYVTWHLFDGKGRSAINDAMVPYAKNKGIEIKSSFEVKNISSDNEIYKVTAHDYNTNSDKMLYGRNIVIATGGYLNNKEMLQKTTFSKKQNILPVNSGKNTGDGIKMAWKLGAKKFITGMKMRFGTQLKDENTLPYKLWESNLGGLALRAQPVMWVNENGDRFIDENHAVDDWSIQGNAINRQEKVFAIMDQKLIDLLTDERLLKSMAPIYLKNTIPGLRDEIESFEKENKEFINKADSIEELQKLISAPNLAKTVSKYNEFSKNRKDLDFNKPAEYLLSVDKGPFYAFEVGCGAYTSGDGLKVDSENRVLDDDGRVIKGLYAIGSDGSGIMYGDTYGVELSGSHAGYCVFSGRNAIKNIEK